MGNEIHDIWRMVSLGVAALLIVASVKASSSLSKLYFRDRGKGAATFAVDLGGDVTVPHTGERAINITLITHQDDSPLRLLLPGNPFMSVVRTPGRTGETQHRSLRCADWMGANILERPAASAADAMVSDVVLLLMIMSKPKK